MKVDIGQLKEAYLKKTRANIIDIGDMQIIIPVLLREIDMLERKLEASEESRARLEAKRPPLERKGKNGNAEWEVRYDTATNRLYIKLGGIFDSKSAKTVSNHIVTLISYTAKDFDVINDVKNLDAISDLRVLFYLKKVRYHLKQSGVKKVVRIIDKENKVIAKLFGNTGAELTEDVLIVESLEEATKILDSQPIALKV